MQKYLQSNKRLLFRIIFVLIILFILLVIFFLTRNNLTPVKYSDAPSSYSKKTSAEFLSKYRMTKSEFNQHWQAQDGFQIIYNNYSLDPNTSSQIVKTLESLPEYSLYNKSLGMGTKEFYKYLIKNGLNLKPINDNDFNLLYDIPFDYKTRSFVTTESSEIFFINDTNNKVYANIFDIFELTKRKEFLDLFGLPPVEFKDKLNPGGHTFFYPQLGLALHTNPPAVRYELFSFKPKAKLDEKFIDEVGLNERYRLDNPNSIFLELPPTNK